jgi:predicted enzyme related to lactoylglutathione lyase
VSRPPGRLFPDPFIHQEENLMPAPASNTVAWFEIGAPDVAAAQAFYGPLFGWTFAPDDGYTLITAAGAAGPSGGIFHTGGNIPPYAVFVVKVDDVPATCARTEELGGKVIVAPMTMGDGMAVAYLADPNGSMFALFSPKPEGPVPTA